MKHQRRLQKRFVTASLAAGLSAATGCMVTAHAQTSIKSSLLAPKDSVSFDAKPGPAVAAPIGAGTMSLPYPDVLPLADGPIGDQIVLTNSVSRRPSPGRPGPSRNKRV